MDEYNNKKRDLQKIVKEDAKKGQFVAMEGDVDNRGPEKLDVKLSTGFKISCGLRGSKLSGG